MPGERGNASTQTQLDAVAALSTTNAPDLATLCAVRIMLAPLAIRDMARALIPVYRRKSIPVSRHPVACCALC